MGTVCSVWDDGRLPRMCVSMRVNPSGVRSPDFRAAWLCPRLLELRAHLQEVGVDTVRPPSHIPCAIHMRASYTQRGRPSSDISRGQQQPQQLCHGEPGVCHAACPPQASGALFPTGHVKSGGCSVPAPMAQGCELSSHICRSSWEACPASALSWHHIWRGSHGLTSCSEGSCGNCGLHSPRDHGPWVSLLSA